MAVVDVGTFCYVDGAHAALNSPLSWPEKLEAPSQVHQPEFSMPKYFGAFVYTMLTVVNVVAHSKPPKNSQPKIFMEYFSTQHKQASRAHEAGLYHHRRPARPPKPPHSTPSIPS